MIDAILLLSKSKDLPELIRDAVPGLAVRDVTVADGTERIAVVDVGSADGVGDLPASIVVRILLHRDGDRLPERRDGDLRLLRSAFEENPVECLSWAEDLSENHARLEKLERELEIARKARDLLTDADQESVFEKVTLTALDLLGVAHGTLLLHDRERERYEVIFTNEPSYEDNGAFLPGVPSELLDRSMEERSAYAVGSESGDVGIVALPMRIGDDLIGVLRARVAKTDAVEQSRATLAASYLEAVTGVLIHARQLTLSNELVLRDDLTRAFNRRFFETYLDQEIERSRRYGSQFSIIFLDLDDLKDVNNRYGHLMGSRTLQEVAKRVLGAVRSIDRVVRFGGDEFCIILPQTDEVQSEAVANRVRSAICVQPFHLEPGLDVAITASFGIASFPRHARSKEELIRVADAAMYRVKSSTKNSIEVAVDHE